MIIIIIVFWGGQGGGWGAARAPEKIMYVFVCIIF